MSRLISVAANFANFNENCKCFKWKIHDGKGNDL